MVRLIGIRRILAIVLLAAFLVILFLYNSVLMKPDIRQMQQELARSKAEVAEMGVNIDKLMQGIELFKSQESEFLQIQKFGFFDDQDRVEARRRLNLMQKESRLLSAKYTIMQAVDQENEKAQEAGYKEIATEISFELEALDDTDIYNFIYMLNYGFPGQVSITSLAMSREKEITQPLLRKIGVGETEPLVKAGLKVNWTTMIPDGTLSSVRGQE